MASDVSLRKASPCIGEQILPFSLECSIVGGVAEGGVVLDHHLLRQVRLQAATPLAESSRVVSRVVLDALERETALGAGLGSRDESGCTGQARVGPHVFAHEVLGLVARVPRFGECRGTDDCRCTGGFECKVDELEVLLVKLYEEGHGR